MAAVGWSGRGDAPPILTLLDVSDEHRAAFEYDWRTRFGCAFDPPQTMSWGETWRLTTALANDPSSHVAAALAGWDYPVSREYLALADLYDVFVQANTKKGRKPKPYPRPWPDKNKSRPRPTVTPEVAIAALRQAGHTAALPGRFQALEQPDEERNHGDEDDRAEDERQQSEPVLHS